MKQLGVLLLFLFIFQIGKTQSPTPESQQFYYNAQGVSYVPAMTKPGLIYQGQLYNGKRRLDYLIAKLDDPRYRILYNRYRVNRTWASVLTILGTATSVVGLTGTNDNRNINWFLLGGGIVLNASAAVVNAIAAQELRAIAVLMDQQHKTLGMISSPNNLGIKLPLKK